MFPRAQYETQPLKTEALGHVPLPLPLAPPPGVLVIPGLDLKSTRSATWCLKELHCMAGHIRH